MRILAKRVPITTKLAATAIFALPLLASCDDLSVETRNNRNSGVIASGGGSTRGNSDFNASVRPGNFTSVIEPTVVVGRNTSTRDGGRQNIHPDGGSPVKDAGSIAHDGGIVRTDAGTPTTDGGQSSTISCVTPDRSSTVNFSSSFLSIDPAQTLGTSTAPVTMIWIVDTQEPFDRRFYSDPEEGRESSTFQSINNAHVSEGVLRIGLHHYPFQFFYESAPEFSRAIICAGEQGKTFDMLDVVFRGSYRPDSSAVQMTISSYAASIGLDMTTFNSCFESDRSRQRVQNDLDSAIAAGIDGIPTFLMFSEATGRCMIIAGSQSSSVFHDALRYARGQ